MNYSPAYDSAIDFSESGKIEEWIHLFLCGEGGNEEFSRGLKLKPRLYSPPVLMKLDNFSRCCGLEDNMRFKVPAIDFNKRVEMIIERYKKGNWKMPPLIINRENGRYELSDGNHRYEALKRLGFIEYWVIIWETAE